MTFEEKKPTFRAESELSIVRLKLQEIEEQLEPLREHEWEYTNTMVKLEEAMHWIEKLYATAGDDV